MAASEKKADYCIDIVKLSKSFKRQTLQAGYTTLKSALLGLVSAPARLFAGKWSDNGEGQKEGGNKTIAIDNLTLRVKPGQAVGIIGRNGSGKSTLLKLVTGIYTPDQGKISINGRLAALIELGAGFHPDFTGRENVYLSGAMYGMSRAEIDKNFKHIVEFAELEQVIDDPVRTYSSGMFMRLGFSVAVHTDPDILLIDEVLAVGDATFSVKCRDKLSELKRNGKTFLLVSHDLSAVERWCDEVVWLHQGQVKDRGEPRRVIDHYREFVERGEELELEKLQKTDSITTTDSEQKNLEENSNEIETEESKRWGSKEIEITGIKLKNAQQEEHLVFHPEDNLNIQISYQVHDTEHITLSETVFGIGIHRLDGLVIHGSNTELEGIKLPNLGNKGTVNYNISRLGLLDGRYRLDVAVHRQDGYPYDYHLGALIFSVRSPIAQVGVYVPPHQWLVQDTGGKS